VPQRRSDIVDSENPGVYHCISRCVRREALLCSDQRKRWLVERLQFLASRMAVDVVSFAVMDNHLHLLLRIRPDVVGNWSDREVAERRLALLTNRKLRQRAGIAPESPPTEAELRGLLGSPRLLRRAREELSSLGFFHRLLKEPCARAWNREDGVTGHFWEGRFLSPRVLDHAALLRVARYVELNAVRAGLADSIPASIWTSAKLQWDRLVDAMRDWLREPSERVELHLDRVEWTPVFACDAKAGAGSQESADASQSLNISLADYLLALEASGRNTHPAKRGRLRDLKAAIVRAADSVCEEASASAARLLAEWAGKREEWLHANPATAEIGRSAAPNLRRPIGSCYGSAASVAVEAARRGVRRLLSIPTEY
jgi:REP element-mobilizing transposase RayT